MNNLLNEHLVIVRTGASVINLTSYNCQELGLAKSLVKKGLRVSIILAGKKKEKKTILYQGHLIEIYYVKYVSINQAISWFYDLGHLLRNLNPTVIQIHEFGMFMSLRVLCWARKRNIKTILIQGSYQTTHKPLFKQLESIYNLTLGKYLLNHVDNIGYKSLMASKYIHKYSSVQTYPTYIGLDIDKFQFETNERNWIEDLHLKNKKILLYIGTIEQRRNPLFLAKLMKRMPQDYVLLIVGNGPQYIKLKNYSFNENLTDKIKLLGKLKQEELPSLYKIADLFLLASSYEIYGMVILESMYFGTPVLSTMTAGAEVLINNNIDGAIIKEGLDEQKWIDKINELFNNPDSLKKMGEKASLKIKEYFIWDQACLNFLKAYNISPTLLKR